MSHMQPQIVDCGYWEIENDDGSTEFIPYEHGARPESQVAVRQGYLWRLSAPGFLDCTEWTPADSISDAVRDMLGMHGDGFDESDLQILAGELEGFDEFWEGYLLGLAFTGWREFESGNPEPIYNNPGGDISEVVDTGELLQWLDESDRVELLSDCLAFFTDAAEMIGDEFERAGADFHLTRNGHGAGFWDGDWPEFGDKLTELSKPYGQCELVQFGDTLNLMR